MTDLIILATLLSGPRHGYRIKRQAGMILGQELLHNNLVYPLLRRFMAKRWVTRKAVPGERGQMRQQYALTALGRKELIDRLSAFNEQEARMADAFRFRIGMFQLLGPDARSRILDLREQWLRNRLERLKGIQANFGLERFAGEVISQFCADTENELGWIGHLSRISKKEKKEG